MSTETSGLLLLQKYYSADTIAKEPWNDDSVLYVPTEVQQLQNGALSLASYLYLKKLNLQFTVKFAKNVSEMSPSGKSPLLKCGKYAIGEYDSIIKFCELKRLTLNPNASNETKSDIKTYLSLIETQFSDAINYYLFNEPEGRQSLKEMYASLYPWPLNHILFNYEYYFTSNKLNMKNIWKLDKKQILKRLFETIQAIDRKLNDNRLYIIENKLSEVDLLLYSYIKYIKNEKQFNEIEINCINSNNHKNINQFYNNMNLLFNHLIINGYNKSLVN